MVRPRSSPRRPASGFTLIELLVVIAIIAVLIALLVPAVQKVRAAAARTQCTNNLKQMALACHTFQSTHKGYPSCDLGDNWPTWAVLIMPYIEQDNLFKQWNVAARYYNQKPEASGDLPIYHCPARSVPGKNGTVGETRAVGGVTRTGPYGWGDYAICGGQGTQQTGMTWTPHQWNGFGYRAWHPNTGSYLNSAQVDMFEIWPGWKYMRKYRDITDGVSNTFAFGEKHYPPTSTGGVIYNGDNQSQYMRFAGREGTQDPVTKKWTIENTLITDPTYTASDWPLRFTSTNHAGVGMFALADGSVRPVQADISVETLHRLGVVNDGLVVGDY